MNIKTKICSCCKQEKPLSEFGKCTRNKDGLKYSCKVCRRNKSKNYAIKNHDKILEKHKVYRETHREELKQKAKIYHSTHKEQERNYKLVYKREVERPYCISGNESKIENYQIAKSENFKDWDRHHRLETHTSEGIKRLIEITRDELIALDMYYNRPPEELIYIRHSEHSKIHKLGKGGKKIEL